MAWIGERLALVQDDANFVALVDPESGAVESVTLPAGKDDARQFDDGRGNKKFKLDLEACCSVAGPHGPVLLAFGSGSTRRRRQVLRVDRWSSRSPRVNLTDATALYEDLETVREFAGSDMNIEGVVSIGDRLRIFGRGNGKARDGARPLDATCDLSLHDLLRWLDDPDEARMPRPTDIVQYTLGEIDGIALGFTDAAERGGRIYFTASAEASEDASTDGEVAGSVIGVMTDATEPRYVRLADARGRVVRDKVEGLALSSDDASRLWVVIDADDPARPSELCEVRLSGRWD